MEIWLFILGYTIHFTASALLLTKIVQQKSVYGLSLDTQLCFLFSTLSRCVWALDTRLVETWMAYMELVASTLIAFMLTYCMYKYRHTNIKTVCWPLKAQSLLPAAMVVAFILHPGRQWFTVQVLVAFSIYAEAVALLPQLWLMRRMIEVEPLTSNYVGLLVLSRIVRIFFWVTLYLQGEHFVGLCVADCLHSILSADYFLLWCNKLRRGGTLIYKI